MALAPRRLLRPLLLSLLLEGVGVARGNLAGFGGNGTGFTINSYLSNASGVPPSVSSNVATLTTDGLTNQHTAASIFANTPQDVDAFQASFTYQIANSGATRLADGVTFTLQNDPRQAAALGGQGKSLGYGAPVVGTTTTPATTPIVNSVGISLDVYATPGTLLTGFESGGNASYTNTATPANTVKSGDVIGVTLTYNGAILTETVQDLTENSLLTTFSESVNIPALVNDFGGTVGSNLAYVGFTGGTGGSYATQKISDFTYTVVTPTATPPPFVPEPATWVAGVLLLVVSGSLAHRRLAWPPRAGRR